MDIQALATVFKDAGSDELRKQSLLGHKDVLYKLKTSDMVTLLNTYKDDNVHRLGVMKSILATSNIELVSRDLSAIIATFPSSTARLEALRHLVDRVNSIEGNDLLMIVRHFDYIFGAEALQIAMPKVRELNLESTFRVMDVFRQVWRSEVLSIMCEKIGSISQEEFNSYKGGLDRECVEILRPKIKRKGSAYDFLRSLDGVDDANKFALLTVAVKAGLDVECFRENREYVMSCFEDRSYADKCLHMLGIAYDNPIIDVMGQKVNKSTLFDSTPFKFGKASTITLKGGCFEISVRPELCGCVVSCPVNSLITIRQGKIVECNGVVITPQQK